MQDEINLILSEVGKVILGKEAVIRKMLMSILASGHILLDDMPGVGKTTLAVTLGRVLGLTYRRVQFTPDVLPSDITGFSIYNKQSGGFEYMPGAVTDANLLLGDEINRTSSKTQSALFEAMEEGQITVDGETHKLQTPFIVIATQNNVGTAGTSPLPYAQLDRFLVRLSLGYPDYDSQMSLLRDRQTENPLDSARQVLSREKLVEMQGLAARVTIKDSLIAYITKLTMATRDHPAVEVGVSPRGALHAARLAKACAFVDGRDYALPEDVLAVFGDVCAHRLIVNQSGRAQRVTAEEILGDVIGQVKTPDRE
jgi:MoxR-like ATPase